MHKNGHWGIETGLHYRRDVTLKEDTVHIYRSSQMAAPAHTSKNLALLITIFAHS